MLCPYCKTEIREVDSIKTSFEEIRGMICEVCQIRFNLLFMDGELIEAHAHKIIEN